MGRYEDRMRQWFVTAMHAVHSDVLAARELRRQPAGFVLETRLGPLRCVGGAAVAPLARMNGLVGNQLAAGSRARAIQTRRHMDAVTDRVGERAELPCTWCVLGGGTHTHASEIVANLKNVCGLN